MVECHSLCLTLGWTGNGHQDETDCLLMMWSQNIVANESLFMNLVALSNVILSCYIQASLHQSFACSSSSALTKYRISAMFHTCIEKPLIVSRPD